MPEKVSRKKRSLEELLLPVREAPYEEQAAYIDAKVLSGELIPVKSSPGNGRRPVLYTRYWELTLLKDYSELERELLYGTVPGISTDYYLHNLPEYEKDRKEVRLLDAFLRSKRERLKEPVSMNERCFEIWGDEKYLKRSRGLTVLSRCGLGTGFLNTYETAEPFAYYTVGKETPQNLLILENKDPFVSMRRHLMAGAGTILSVRIGTLIYGAGKRVNKSMSDFPVSAEPYMKEKGNRFFYFGDLDYEGIGIYERLAEDWERALSIEIRPFLPAYEAMLEKAEGAPRLPMSSEKQNRHIGPRFFSFFGEESAGRMREILQRGAYIPQEILNISDF